MSNREIYATKSWELPNEYAPKAFALADARDLDVRYEGAPGQKVILGQEKEHLVPEGKVVLSVYGPKAACEQLEAVMKRAGLIR